MTGAIKVWAVALIAALAITRADAADLTRRRRNRFRRLRRFSTSTSVPWAPFTRRPTRSRPEAGF